MGSPDDQRSDVNTAADLARGDAIDGALADSTTAGESKLGPIYLCDVRRQSDRHGVEVRLKRSSRQDLQAQVLSIVQSGSISPVSKSPAQERYERWMTACEQARKKAAELTRPGGPLSQNRIAKQIQELGEPGAKQRTVGRLINGEGTPRIDTFFRVLAVVPEAGDAFEDQLQQAGVPTEDASRWARITARLAALMKPDDGYKLADILDDLMEYGVLDTSWPHLKRALVDARRATNVARDESPAKEKMSK